MSKVVANRKFHDYPGAGHWHNTVVASGVDSSIDLHTVSQATRRSGSHRFNLRSSAGLKEAYDTCSTVGMVVSRLAASLVNGRLVIRNKKTLAEVNYGYERVLKFLKQPNALQTFSEFMTDLDITKNVFGVAVIYVERTLGMAFPSSLHILNPDKIKVKYKKASSLGTALNKEIESAIIQVGSAKFEVRPEDLILFYDAAKSVIDDSNMLSVTEGYRDITINSRLAPLNFEISNIVQAQEAIYALNKDRGAQGIISNAKKDAAGYMPLTAEERNQLKQAYREYGMRASDEKIIITDASIKWEQMSYSVKDLMLFEGIKSNMCSIADAYNYPFELLANDKGSTYSNKDAAKKYLYQDTIGPMAVRYAELLGVILPLRASDEYYFDYSHLEVMQESAKDQAVAKRGLAQALHVAYQNGAITKEEFRRELGMPEEVFGKTYIDPAILGRGISVTNQSPRGTGYDNNDIDNNE